MQTVRPGQTVSFDCGGKPQIKIEAPMSFQWSRDGGLPAGRSRDNGYGLLVLTSVEEIDSGTYVCTVSAGIYKVEEKMELKVEDPRTTTEDSWRRQSFNDDHTTTESYWQTTQHMNNAQNPWRSESYTNSRPRYHDHQYERCPDIDITVDPSDQVVAEGETATLQCSVSGAEVTRVRVEWSKVRDTISPRTDTSHSRLVLAPVTLSDRGLYVCTVTTECGTMARSSAVLEVEQRQEPELELYPGPQHLVSLGGSVMIQCRLLGKGSFIIINSRL